MAKMCGLQDCKESSELCIHDQLILFGLFMASVIGVAYWFMHG